MGAQASALDEGPDDSLDEGVDIKIEAESTKEPSRNPQETSQGYRAALRELFNDLQAEKISTIGAKYGRRFLSSSHVQQVLQDPRWKQTFSDESVEAAKLVFDVLVRLGGPLVGIHPWELLNSVRALSYLQEELRTEPDPIDVSVDGETPPEGDFEEMKTYMPFAVAAYGHALPALLGIVPIRESDWTEEAAIRHLTGVDTNVDLITTSFGTGLYNAGHFVAVNRATKEVIVSVRGTYQLEDLITDVVMEESPFTCRLPRIPSDQPSSFMKLTSSFVGSFTSEEQPDVQEMRSWKSKAVEGVLDPLGLKVGGTSATQATHPEHMPHRSYSTSSGLSSTSEWWRAPVREGISNVLASALDCIGNTISSVTQSESTDALFTRSSSLISFNARFDEENEMQRNDSKRHLNEKIVGKFVIVESPTTTEELDPEDLSGGIVELDAAGSIAGGLRSAFASSRDSTHAEVVELQGKTHGGWLKAAQALDAKLSGPVSKALEANPGYRLVVTGHSMGATISSLLTLMWAEREEFSSVRCYAFATPGTLTLPMARHPLIRQRIFSVSLGNDFVSRFGHPNLTDLRGALLRLAQPCPWDVRKRSFAQVVLHRGTSKRSLKRIMELLERQEMNSEKLFPAGTLWYAGVYGIHKGTGAQRVAPEFFGELLLTADMFTTHFGSLITLSRYGGVDIHRYVQYLGI